MRKFNSVQNLKLVCNKGIDDNILTNLLCDLGLGEAIYKKVSLLSGGMKRRLAIGRALVFDADVIIMDEPFKGLDIELRKKIIELVKVRTVNKTLIIVTHSIEEAKLLDADIIAL